MNVKKCVRALLCLYLTLIIAMDAVKAQTLKVGDTLPPELWSMPLQVINHPEGKDCITLEEYKDKLIILDFWATWCAPCIAMLPKQDSLQRQFKDLIQILPVTYQTVEEVSTFMEKYEKRRGRKNSLPKVINNQSLKPYFNHSTIPHYIWIMDGVVKAITGLDEVNSYKIEAMLKEENVTMKTKSQVPRMGYVARNGSLLEFLAHKKPELIARFKLWSSLSPYIPGLGSEINIVRPDENLRFFRITITNLSPMRFYQFAYGEGSLFTNLASIDVQVKDSVAVKQISTVSDFSKWKENYTYCYELNIPEGQSSDAFKLFRDQLPVLFPQYKVEIENRTMAVLALERNGDVQLKDSSEEKFKESYDGFTYRFSGGSPLIFAKGLDGIYLSHIGKPIVDMTGLDKKIELTLEVNMSNVDELNTALRAQGLELRERVATVPVLVIKDNL